ncbi:zinc-ribbon domain-containing protein, partial [Myxococcota bacterium]|nr:zinc-ribbon domain-containing protein [Myxococcota bacterium]
MTAPTCGTLDRTDAMLFHCPSCSAGHDVPVAKIPATGLELMCRRCGELFLVERPEPTDAAGGVELHPAEEGLDPELDDTIRVDLDEDPGILARLLADPSASIRPARPRRTSPTRPTAQEAPRASSEAMRGSA